MSILPAADETRLHDPSRDEESDAAPNRSDRQTASVPWGKRAAGGSLTSVGLRPPSVRNLVVARHIDDFKPIIEGKFERDEWEFYERHGRRYPKIVITLEDMQRSGAKFTINVLDAGFRPRS